MMYHSDKRHAQQAMRADLIQIWHAIKSHYSQILAAFITQLRSPSMHQSFFHARGLWAPLTTAILRSTKNWRRTRWSEKSATWLLSQLRRILIDFNMYITARGAGKYTNSTFCTSVLGIRSRLLADACSQCESNNRRRDMYSSLPLRFSETNKQTTCSENDFVCEKQPWQWQPTLWHCHSPFKMFWANYASTKHSTIALSPVQ